MRSDTDTSGELVVLTETAADSAIFAGTVQLGPSPSAGTVAVAAGDTLTATYVDADNGRGDLNISVIADAPVDCTPPAVSNVVVENHIPGRALIAFDSDKPVIGSVDYGLDCSSLTESATALRYATENLVDLTGLQPDAVYHLTATGVDRAGAAAAPSECLSFTAAHQPVHFTEDFTDGDNDLDHLSIAFTPNDGPDGYSACVTPITTLPTDPTGGVNLPAADNFYTTVNLSGGAAFPFYGADFTRVYIGGNGYLTFDFGVTWSEESPAQHFQYKCISALADDLDLSAGGQASYRQLADRFVVTFESVPEHDLGGANTFQVELYFDGRITLSYLGLTATDGLVGLSPGGGTPEFYLETDVTSLGACTALDGDLNCDGAVNFGDIDPFVLALTDAAGYAAAFPNCNRIAADTNGDGVVNFGDIDSFVALLTGG